MVSSGRSCRRACSTASCPRTRAANPLLLDGAPVVKDVVFDRSSGRWQPDCWPRTGTRRSLLGLAMGTAGYYALDVTDPAPNSNLTQGPQFLWQLTSMPLATSASRRPSSSGNTARRPPSRRCSQTSTGRAHTRLASPFYLAGRTAAPTGGACARAALAGNRRRADGRSVRAAQQRPVLGGGRHARRRTLRQHRPPRHG